MFRNYWVGAFALAVLSSGPVRGELAGTNLLMKPIHISAGPEDGRITYKTAQLLEYYHFTHHPLDREFAGEFLDSYMETLDRQHLYFVQTDLADFDRFRTNLDRMTLNSRHNADVTPAFEIFSVFINRLQERVAYVEDLLQHDEFDFHTDERVAVSRKDLPYPDTVDQAKQLWRKILRWEYLQEKIALEDAKKNALATNNPAKGIREQIVETLTHRYQRNLRYYADWNNQDVLGEYLTALAHVYDPHSDYFNRAQLEQFTIGMNLALFGIGAELGVDENGYCKINRLLPGGPAEKGKKLKAGDRIVAVAQSNQPPVDVIDMSLNKTVQLIRGPKGTQVQLTVIPEHETAPRTIIKLVRDEISLPDSAAKGEIIDMPTAFGQTNRLGVINLPSFYAPMGPSAHSGKDGGEYTSVDVEKLLTKFKHENVDGVILDLRYNGGGSLDEAIKLAGLFIKEGPIVQVKASNGQIVVLPDPNRSCQYDGPLMVLTSRFSASASEIVAAALQDYGRALIVGDISTHGKGTVQSVNYITNYITLDDPDKDNGALKVTVQKFYRASGVSTQLKGVSPDIVLPSVWNYSKDVGESSLDHPLECDTIPSASYEKLNLVTPYLSELLKSSNERVATNKDYDYVRQEIDKFRKDQADKTVSLNEATRRKEIEDKAAQDKARNRERLARKAPEQTVYELSLKQADLPGLPPPVQKTNSLAAGNGSSKTNSLIIPGEADASPSAILSAAGQNTSAKGGKMELDDEQAPAVDVNLIEAERILEDYIAAMEKRGTLTSTHSPL